MLETKDLILKHAEFDDWQDMLHNIWSREESARHMLWCLTTTEEDAKARILRTIENQKKNPYCWFVYEKKSSQAIGFAGMLPVSDGIWEDCGIAVGPDFVGKGYGKQLLSALVDHAFTQLGAKRFVSACRSANAPSRGMILSCGFRYTHSEERTDPRTDEGYTLEFYERANG